MLALRYCCKVEVGREQLCAFVAGHFIFRQPKSQRQLLVILVAQGDMYDAGVGLLLCRVIFPTSTALSETAVINQGLQYMFAFSATDRLSHLSRRTRPTA